MTTKMQALTPNIMVEDVRQTITFYRDILGFNLVVTVPEGDGPLDWAMMQRDSIKLMFQSRNSLGAELPRFQHKEIGGALTLYIDVEDIKDLYEMTKGKVQVIQDMHQTFYDAQEFAIVDCNGYVLTFAEQV